MAAPYLELAAACSNLRSINLGSTLGIDPFLEELAKAAKGKLVCVKAASSDISSRGLLALSQHCPNLERLDLYSTMKITWDSWKIFPAFTNLRHLNLRQASSTQDLTEALRMFVPSVTKLRTLIVNRASDSMADLISEHLRYLEDFRCDGSGVNDPNRFVRVLVAKCPRLQHFQFLGSRISAEGILHLARLKNLRVLDLSKSQQLTDKALAEIWECHPSPIRELVLGNCLDLSDDTIERIIARNPEELQVLSIAQDRNITTKFMYDLVTSCKLTRLVIGTNEKIAYQHLTDLKQVATRQIPSIRIE